MLLGHIAGPSVEIALWIAQLFGLRGNHLFVVFYILEGESNKLLASHCMQLAARYQLRAIC